MRTPLFKRIAIGCLTALLLMAGYYWIQRSRNTSPSPVARSQSTPVADTSVTADVPDTSAIDTASITKEPTRKEPPIATVPRRTDKPNQPTERPTASSQQPTPAEAVEKPAPPKCDQLVMRNGDLIDAKILEIGVNEIRYRKCRREDGPEYVVSKSDVLSIRYANGDIERFSSRTNVGKLTRFGLPVLT